MRVLRVITRLNIGGPAIQALMLTKELRHDFPTVLAAGAAPPEEGELSDPDVDVHRVPLVRPLRPALDLAAFRAIRGLVAHDRPAIVHTHMAKAGALGRLAAMSSRPRPRTVHTFHGHVLDGYFGRAKERAFLAVERYLGRHTDALVAVSQETRNELLDLGIGTPERWRVIPLGFDLHAFEGVQEKKGKLLNELGIADGAFVVGVLGRLAPVKDHALLLRAVALMADAHLVVVGDGELRGPLERQSQEAGLAGRVHFVGWRRDIPDVLADLDLVALTSLNEGTPVSLIEALAAGRPVVACDVGGVRSVVRDGVDGLLVPTRSPQAIAKTISRLMGNAVLRKEFGNAGRERVLATFSKDRLLADMRSLYNELLSS